MEQTTAPAELYRLAEAVFLAWRAGRNPADLAPVTDGERADLLRLILPGDAHGPAAREFVRRIPAAGVCPDCGGRLTDAYTCEACYEAESFGG